MNKENTKVWYSPIYQKNDYGFYVEKNENICYLGFKTPNGKECIEVKISQEVFNSIEKDWREKI